MILMLADIKLTSSRSQPMKQALLVHIRKVQPDATSIEIHQQLTSMESGASTQRRSFLS